MSLLPTDPNRCRVRFLEQLLTEATAAYWDRRAQTFEACRPSPADYPGRAGRAALRARDQRCREVAEACRHHAELIRDEGLHGAARMAYEALAEANNGDNTPAGPR